MNGSLEILAFVAGILTVLSPCILPILPALLGASVSRTRSHRPFWIVLGLAASFALSGSLFAVFKTVLGIGNGATRAAAIVILLFFSVSLLVPKLWERIGATLSSRVQNLPVISRLSPDSGPGGSMLLGAALGLVWAPCAGPILGIILTLATVQASFPKTFLLMAGYALGAAVPMLMIGYGGQGVARTFARFRRLGAVAPKLLGVVTLAAVIGMIFNLDTALLSRLPSQLFLSNLLEEKLVRKTPTGVLPPQGARTVALTTASSLPVLGRMPEFSGISGWLNSPPLTARSLRGKVVLVDFWTYSCINCIRTLPAVNRWYGKYKDQGLVIVGVHTPEFAFEKNRANIAKAVTRFGINYPVAIDSSYRTWNAYANQFWPADYLIDSQGRIREVEFGEGNDRKIEQGIQALLAESGRMTAQETLDQPSETVDFSKILSPETYLGFARATHFKSPEGPDPDTLHRYTVPARLGTNDWALGGLWTIKGDKILLDQAGGTIRFRFRAPKLNIVMKGPEDGSTARVYLDGIPISPALFGKDLGQNGTVRVKGARLYNLVTLDPKDSRDHLFEIRFARPGVSAYTFTFG